MRFPTSAIAAALLLIPSLITAVDPDCELPASQVTPDSPLYSGFSLKIGTACAQFVSCQSGVISSWHTCPSGLIYNGKVGEVGICDYKANAKCKDPELMAASGEDDNALGSATAAAVTAADPDCELPASQVTPNSPLFSGYSLKIGQACAQYVYCENGAISSWLTCPSGLLYNGNVGEGGICDNEANVECKDPELMAAGGGEATDEVTETTPATQPAATVAAEDPSSNNNNNRPSNNPGNNFCGRSADDAANLCRPCASGRMMDCPEVYHGCFRGITACAAQGGSASNASSGGGSIGGTPNDNMNNIINQYVAATIAQEENQSYDSQTNMDAFQQMDVVQQTTTEQNDPAPGPTPTTLSPTLPPWTNAPFNPSPGGSKTVIGYYASWQWYDRFKLADPTNIDFSKYDRINYAFFQPCPEGNLYGTDEWADPQLLWGPWEVNPDNQFISGPNMNYFCSWDGPNVKNCHYHQLEGGLLRLAKNAGAEVMPSIGGWTLSDNFPVIAASEAKRQHFASQCVELIEAYGFDGIDIDWEYPGYEDHSGTPADTINFTLLLQAVRSALDTLGDTRGKFYGLTAALPCGPDKIDMINIDQIMDILTELNLMTYDMHGAWDELTGTNAPMFDQGWTDTTKRWSVHGCVNTYVESGVPLSKINIGLPFYGRSYQKATGMKQFHGGVDDINYHLDEGSPQYFNIVNELKRMTTYRHEKTETQYAVFNDGNRGLVSYDDPRAICEKVGYANERGMHGFLIWEISGDMIDNGNSQISTPLIDATIKKIQNPNFPCSTLRDPAWALSDQNYRYAPAEPETVDRSNYVAPVNTGSGNDYNGANGAQPNPAPTGNLPVPNTSSNNAVYTSPSSSGNNAAASSPSSDDCPPGLTGYRATSGCAKYMYCRGGSIVGVAQPCVPGTLFDVSIGVCTWAADVKDCGAR